MNLKASAGYKRVVVNPVLELATPVADGMCSTAVNRPDCQLFKVGEGLHLAMQAPLHTLLSISPWYI